MFSQNNLAVLPSLLSGEGLGVRILKKILYLPAAVLVWRGQSGLVANTPNRSLPTLPPQTRWPVQNRLGRLPDYLRLASIRRATRSLPQRRGVPQWPDSTAAVAGGRLISRSLIPSGFGLQSFRRSRFLGGGSGDRLLDIGHVFTAEVLLCRQHRINRKDVQGAQALAVHLIGDALQFFNIFGGGLTMNDVFHQFRQPMGAFTTGRAFAAAFVFEEFNHLIGGPHHVGAFVHQNERG